MFRDLYGAGGSTPATQAMAGPMFQKFVNSQLTNPALKIAVNCQADPQMCGFTIILAF